MGNGKVIAVWGSPGSGTTLTSVKLARELANLKKNVILVLCDNETPMIPLLVPEAGEAKSLGELLSMPTITTVDIFGYCIPVGPSLSLFGYLREENENTWPEYSETRALKFIGLLRDIANYTVIDCSHHLLYSVLTAVALKESDVVFHVLNADPKSLIYLKSQEPLLRNDPQFRYDQHINIINNVRYDQPTAAYEEAFGGKAYTLPYLPALQTQYTEARLLEPLTGREGRLYEPIIRAIVMQEILLLDSPAKKGKRRSSRIPAIKKEEVLNG